MTLPSFRLDQQTALVTGAASGIGRGIALGLAAAGANVACFDLPESALDEVCGEIRAAGQDASPSMSGSIVNRGLLQAHYNASKAAVVHLSRSLAMEWAHRGIRVNSISPGYTATPMNLRPEVAEQVTKFEADTPLGRMATVDELVGPAIFLLSDAASFCTGVDLLVDGGFTCW